jgi:hypothetical protein
MRRAEQTTKPTGACEGGEWEEEARRQQGDHGFYKPITEKDRQFLKWVCQSEVRLENPRKLWP